MPDEPSSPLLNDSQRRIVGTALTLLSLISSIALVIVAIYVLGRLLGFFSGVLWPIAVAGVLALILRPIVHALERRLKLRRLTSVILLYALVVLATAGALLLLLPPLIGQLIDFISYLPELWAKSFGYVQAHYPDWIKVMQRYLENPTVREALESLATESKALFAHAMPSLKAAFGGVMQLAAFLTHLAIIPVYLFFFLLLRQAPSQDLGRNLTFLRPGVRNDVVFLASEFVTIVEAFFRGQLLIGLCMGVLFAIGFTVIGLKFGLVIGLALGVMNIVPYLGTILGFIITIPLAFFQPEGGWHLVGLLILVNVVVQCVEAWFLTPKIMGRQTGLHPAVIIFAVFFWGTAFNGVLGMLLAVPLTAFFVTAWRLAKLKYFNPPESKDA
ncbi:MAG: AI-2E family transporter [Opitutaceae bacterium]|nr:AI-2E family transporter [Opitutaceae bacterium]